MLLIVVEKCASRVQWGSAPDTERRDGFQVVEASGSPASLTQTTAPIVSRFRVGLVVTGTDVIRVLQYSYYSYYKSNMTREVRDPA